MKEKSLRHNEGKLEWSLVDFKSLEPMVRTLQQAYKSGDYPKDNWKIGMELEEVLNSLMRHTVALMDGEEYDRKSGLHHIGHIMCNCMIYEYHRRKLEDEENSS